MEAKVTVAYDYDSCNMRFKEQFQGIEKGYRGEWNYWFYTDYKQVDYTSPKDLFEISTRNSLKRLCNVLGYDVDEYEQDDKDDLIYDIFSTFSIKEIEGICDDLAYAKVKFIKYTTRGYSQGDCEEVIVLKENNFEGIQQYIDNLFWDAEVWVRVELEAGHNFTFEGYEMDLPNYWNFPYDIDDCKKDVKTFLEKRFQFAAAKDKIVNVIMEAFPEEAYTPRC